MTVQNYRVRRATLDDLEQLTAVWQAMRFPVEDLGKRVTEFQIAEGTEGKIIGGVGLQLAQKHGRIHSEAFTDFALADQLRPMLWERVQSVATNHGLLRLWTQEQAPFWSRCGMQKADDEALAKLPELWRTQNSSWFTIKLRDEPETLLSADKEFALFMEAEKQRTQRTFQQAKVAKVVATLLAIIILVLVLVVGYLFLKKSPQFQHRGEIPGPPRSLHDSSKPGQPSSARLKSNLG